MKIKLLVGFLVFVSFTSFSQSSIPYPIIFVHGLNSESNTWSEFTQYLNQHVGLIQGGTMDFCLNADFNYSSSVFEEDYIDFTYNRNLLVPGDFYFVNFNVNPYGVPEEIAATPVQSNQQAIFKQGRAIRDAVRHVLQVTGKDKVILVGHSMGGLASREYLANTEIWQEDGRHHVVKLFTNATPHGGSNATMFGIGIKGLNERSEAVRDLRRSYYYSGDPGVYLYGGIEWQDNEDYMDDNWNLEGQDFHNVDVNCNGYIGETIKGLNQKTSPSDVFYSCAIGVGALLGGDGVVGAYEANMNNYLYFPFPLQFSADTFVYQGSAITEFHTDLTKKLELNLKGLDEPYTYYNAYQIEANIEYTGLVTNQSNNLSIDIDSYSFENAGSNDVRVELNYEFEQAAFFISDGNRNIIHTISHDNVLTDTVLNLEGGGTYYFTPFFNCYAGYAPRYNFSISLVPDVLTSNSSFNTINSESITVYPNPSKGKFTVSSKDRTGKLKVYSILGNFVYSSYFEKSVVIDLSNQLSGIYIVELETETGISRSKVIIE